MLNMNCYSLILVVYTLVCGTEAFNEVSLKNYCYDLGCDDCTMTNLICRSGKMKNFPIVRLNNYKSVDICFQNLLDPTLHKVLFENLEALRR